MLQQEGNRLIFRYDAEKLWIEPWGPDALRIRATKLAEMPSENWALQEEVKATSPCVSITNASASITNGSIKAVVNSSGKLMIYNSITGKLLLEEYSRNRNDLLDPKCSSLQIEARELAPIPGTSSYKLSARFESLDPKEKIYGMGQYQQPYLDLKGLDLELAHRNSQASIPFMVSSLGYGLLWNNPSVGRATFGKHIMTFEAYSTTVLDYWVVASENGRPSELVETYASVTGYVPMMPEYGLGFWQCKLRYQTQEELLEVAREYRRRKLPLDVIVCDFFHWDLQGDWSFDPTYWPDPGECGHSFSETFRVFVSLATSLLTTYRRNGQRAQRHERRAHGLNLAHRRQALRPLPGHARERPPHPHRSWHPNRHEHRRRDCALRRHKSGCSQVCVGDG